MRKFFNVIVYFIITIILSIIGPFLSDGQSVWLLSNSMLYADTLIYWEPEQRVTYDSIPQLHSQVWAYDSFVHILVNYDFPAMYLRSSDYGQTWSDTIRLNVDICTGFQTLVQQESVVYFVWSEYRPGPQFYDARIDTKYVFVKRSMDCGITLDSAVFLGKGAPVAIDAHIETVFVNPVVGDPPPVWGAYLIYSFNGGLNWSTYYPVSDSTDEPNIVYRNGILHFTGSRNYKIIYTRSTDLGNSWSIPTVITAPNTVLPKRPVLALGPNENVYVAWSDNKYSGMMQFDDVLFRKSTDDGLTWGSEQRLTPDSHCDAGGALDMVSQDSMIFTVWGFNGLGLPTPCSLFFLVSTNSGETWRARELVKGGTGFGLHDANVSTTQNFVYVIWEDNEDSSYTYGGDLRIRRGSFSPVGIRERSCIPRYTVNIYPNPFSKFINIKLGNEDGAKGIEIKVFDITGKEVYDNKEKKESETWRQGKILKIDVKALPSGVYFVQLKAGVLSIIKKIVKIR